MCEVSESPSTRRRGRVSYQEDDVDRQYGATWLLDRVAEVTGVKDDLLKVLDGNHEMVNDVLTMARFPFVDNLSHNQLSQWQKEVKAPSEHELNSVNIIRLFGDFPDIAINRSTIAALCSSVLVEPTERFIPCWRAKALARLTEVNEALKANDIASLFLV